VPNLYRRDDCGPPDFELLTTAVPPGFSRELEGTDSKYIPGIQGFSVDGSRTVIRADAVLTPDACKTNQEESKGLFQVYVAHQGNLHLVSVLPNGKPACVHSSVGTMRSRFGNVEEDNVFHAVSDDASRIFWSTSGRADNKSPVTENGGSEDQPGPLYVRENPEGEVGGNAKCSETRPGQACTIRITNDSKARFWGADVKGTTAIYTTGANDDSELFEYDIDTETPTPIAKGVVGVAGMSNDATHVYFVSTEALSGSGANPQGDEAQAGKPNLYLHEQGVGTARFVATLADIEVLPPSPAALFPYARTSLVSGDGTHIAFTSAASPTGYDNTDANSEQPDVEVYLYDAGNGAGGGQLTCVSCNPSGARHAGRAVSNDLRTGEPDLWTAATIPGWEVEFHPDRLLSADGNRLFFESFDGLVPRDTNGKEDVYAWERATDKQDCLSTLGGEVFLGEDPAASGGCLSLISSGQSSADSEFLDASRSGDDVFFTTAKSLLPQDYGLLDVYDARVDGGFPPPPAPKPPCEGEACQPPISPPNDPTPGSASFQGSGNLKPGNTKRSRPCPKAKRRVRKAGRARCVAKHRRAHHRRAHHHRRTAR
jgi:hypothetical protein